jgi:Tol biopolymer transport system component
LADTLSVSADTDKIGGVIPTHRHVSRRAWALAATLGLFFVGCESGQIAAPVNYGVTWTRITNATSAHLAKYPTWSGDRIAFAYLDGTSNINIAYCRPDGSGLTYLSRGAAESQLEPRWINDSTLMYTLTSQSSTKYDVWRRVITTDEIQQLTTFPGNELSPAPRPGSTGLVYTEEGQKGRIVLIPDYTSVTPEQLYITPATMDAGEADWDPAGQRICFSADSTTNYRHIWMVTLAPGDSTPVQLTTGPYFDTGPRFSPDGSRILFASNKRTNRPGLWTIAPSGNPATMSAVAFDDVGAVITTPAWSPDGTKIVVVSTGRGFGQALWVLSNLP